MDKFKKILGNFFHSRSMKYGSNSLIMIIAVVGIAVLVNLMFSFSTLKNLKLDLTPNKVYSIGDVSKTILKAVKQDVYIYGLFDDEIVKAQSGDVNGIDYKGVMELLRKYDSYSNIHLVYKDPDKDPTIIKQIDPENLKAIQKGDIVVKSGNKLRKLGYDDLFDYQYSQDGSSVQVTGFKAEEAFTAAIKYVTANTTPIAYFVTGQQELNPDSSFIAAKDYIEKNNYEIKNLNIITADKIPADASMLVFLSPQRDISVADREKIKDYLRTGGNAIFAFDYLKTNVSLDQFNTILGDYNLSMDNDIVKENNANMYYPNTQGYMILPQIQQSDITSTLDSSLVMFMNQARSINLLKNQKDYITVTEIAKTSDQAVGEQVDKANGPNITGPLDVAVAVESKAYTKPSKILVFGNTAFINDSMYSKFPGGVEFLLGTLNWMQNNKDTVDIAPKQNIQNNMILTSSQTTMVAWVTAGIIPVLILGMGTFVWYRRRHL